MILIYLQLPIIRSETGPEWTAGRLNSKVQATVGWLTAF